jgi:hypothetical protein
MHTKFRAKTAGDLLLDLDHAQIPFGQIAGKGAFG